MFEEKIAQTLGQLGIEDENPGTGTGNQWIEDKAAQKVESISPADGKKLAEVRLTSPETFDQVVEKAVEAFHYWKNLPPPERGEIVRQIGLKLREYKEPLGALVSSEMGKIYQEGLGEVQEMIDICDFAVGQSRQLYGKVIASERPRHRMMEQWHSLGPAGVITAFNFPVAVYSWNAFIAAVCGDTVIWKPSEKTPLCSIAVQKIIARVLKDNDLTEGIFNLVTGDHRIGQKITSEKRIPLVSATGSVRMGKKVGPVVKSRLGKVILELGGNNGIIISQHADIDMALRAILFGAVGTAGQRCTTTRRLIIHDSVYEDFKKNLLNAYKQLRFGHPLDENTIVGPLIDREAVDNFQLALEKVKKEGGHILSGGEKLEGKGFESGCYVNPALAEVEPGNAMVREETFGPLLYLIKYKDFDDALRIHNDVPQGLSSALFSLNVREVEQYLSVAGSDCGIANVNIGTSGAEIGGAFGGEKETGGGREAGSDAWKAYMRRQTNTINWGTGIPLAQGIKFDV